ncbi:hypothetical protein CLOBOL_00048 [Enterocloster bolteae ATCC BAA-613]|uniref:Uncharacterized protein n=1 Tax=Enterocloster bolteae (strain ATCC BAA-613 / DSM 15670 / CCUG 46953 / JCM 12243 / WAL 16351) TaxID=411902 RepID=A8RG55_ENTBW|nr:hypothetical protein CLOBOL_00048 [Enterocloster bolteae ATCC BAA-613]
MQPYYVFVTEDGAYFFYINIIFIQSSQLSYGIFITICDTIPLS